MKNINYKGKGEHSVNELELIIEQQAEELHLLKSGQKQLSIHGVSQRSELLVCSRCSLENDSDSDICYNCLEEIQALT